VVILWSTQKQKSPKLPDIKGFEGLISEKHYSHSIVAGGLLVMS
jgi:hypothetical protein